MSDTLLSRFLRYVQVDTQSDETSKTFPSTSGQLVLLEMLKKELSELGAADVQMTKHGYVLASIPANTRKARVPTVAFLENIPCSLSEKTGQADSDPYSLPYSNERAQLSS